MGATVLSLGWWETAKGGGVDVGAVVGGGCAEEDGADVGVVVSGGWRRRKFLCFDVPALPLAL